jgi:hypothetical protein
MEPVVVEVMSFEVVSVEPVVSVAAEPRVRSPQGVPTAESSTGVSAARETPTAAVSAAAPARVRWNAAHEHQRSDQYGQPN